MDVKITRGDIGGNVRIPPSKSISHRWIICGALAKGRSIFNNIAMSKDITATIDCMKQMGAEITFSRDTVIIDGIGGVLPPSAPLFCGESGSTLRFIIPIAALLDEEIVFTGQGRLMERPQSVYEVLFKKNNLPFFMDGNTLTIHGPLSGGKFKVQGDVSSQFLTGLLFALPLTMKKSILVIQPPFESQSYVNITCDVLQKFGITVEQTADLQFTIPGGQQYVPFSGTVEGDESQSAFFAVLGALGGNIRCSGLQKDTLQGDRAIRRFLLSMGAEMEEEQEGFCVKKSKLYGDLFDLSDCPDLGPIMMTCAALAGSPSKFTGIHRLRIKESDRIATMAEELSKMGAKVEVQGNEMKIIPCVPTGGYIFNGHNDHRVVMSLAVASALCPRPCIIRGAHAVEKSYPNFFEDLQGIGVQVEKVLENVE